MNAWMGKDSRERRSFLGEIFLVDMFGKLTMGETARRSWPIRLERWNHSKMRFRIGVVKLLAGIPLSV
jgi:hypothetical protein